MPLTPYEKRQAAKVRRLTERIKRIYEDSITEIVFRATTFPYKGQLFSLSNFPDLEKLVNEQIKLLHDRIYTAIVNGIEDSWNLANEHNDLLVDKRLAGKIPVDKVMQILYDPNKEALQSFITRKQKGLNLSERVWNGLDPFKKELEQGLGIGIGKGEPSASLATEMKRYLNEPDRLFRRVRGDDGKLYLSKAARDYHPGRGVYRSSYHNARRLTRTETNLAYRYADSARWQNMPFVVGIEVKLSNAHRVFDICDTLKGKYPKDFKFGGWHPHCLCYSQSIQMTDDEYERYEDGILNGTRVNVPSSNFVPDVPKAFDTYLKKEGKNIREYSSKPYWVKDNPKYAKL